VVRQNSIHPRGDTGDGDTGDGEIPGTDTGDRIPGTEA
jgi:hypothetical protein